MPHHKAFAQAGTWSVAKELDESQAWLYDQQGPKRVAIFGAGGIGKQLIKLLQPFGVHITAVNRSGRAVEGADEVVPMDQAESVWGEADFIFCILPATKDTEGLIDAATFRAMKPSAIFINVGRIWQQRHRVECAQQCAGRAAHEELNSARQHLHANTQRPSRYTNGAPT